MENDKAKIKELIDELDQKKNEALKGAHERVNKVHNICFCIHSLYVSKFQPSDIQTFWLNYLCHHLIEQEMIHTAFYLTMNVH